MTDKLFSEFPEASKEQWIKVATKDLRGADFNEKLVWKIAEGFEIQPFYTAEDLPDSGLLKAQQNALLNTDKPEFSPRTWVNCPEIVVNDLEEANRDALNALQNGADGVLFNLHTQISPQNMGVLLKDIMLNYCSVYFKIHTDAPKFLDNLIHFADDHRFALKDISGGILTPDAFLPDDLGHLYGLLRRMPNFRIEVAWDSRPGDAIEQTGFQLFNLLKLWERADVEGVVASDFFKSTQIGISVGNNYFLEIARLRAVRMLAHQAAMILRVKAFEPANVHIHAYTTILADERTLKDPYLNMLSNTNQAMAAIIGGCDILTVYPHNKGLEKTDEFARRIARNVSNILKDESYFDRVADPAAGSYYIESLTDQLAEKIWDAMRKRL
jgi:methylmalonyl-CoA mutase